MTTAKIIAEFTDLVNVEQEYTLSELKSILSDIYNIKNGKKVVAKKLLAKNDENVNVKSEPVSYKDIFIPYIAIIEEIAEDILSELGPGHSESVYHNSMKIGIQDHGLKFETERDIIIKYKDRYVGTVRADIIINQELVIELKTCNATDNLISEALRQCSIYMRETKIPHGIVVIFPKKIGGNIIISHPK